MVNQNLKAKFHSNALLRFRARLTIDDNVVRSRRGVAEVLESEFWIGGAEAAGVTATAA